MMYDFDDKMFGQIYTKDCSRCHMPVKVSTQKDDGCHEYVTDVFVICGECGESVHFELPVN